MHRFFENLQSQAEDQPVLAMVVAAGLITSISKLLNSAANTKNAKAWTKEVERRAKKSQK